MIVSHADSSEVKGRRNYFLGSSIMVGVITLVAVVISIFASDFSLGTGSFELVELIAPVARDAAEPEPPKPRAPAAPTKTKSVLPSRRLNMATVNEPTIVPKTISAAPNTAMARPDSKFTIAPMDTNPGPSAGSGRETTGTGSEPTELVATSKVIEKEPIPEPPPVKTPAPPRPAAPKSLGVINGIAKNLPKPAYPAAALAINAQGKVDVQVVIDESGKVISAKAVSGNALLRQAAEKAAREARFSPTYLSNVAVKVTGVIVYNFSRG